MTRSRQNVLLLAVRRGLIAGSIVLMGMMLGAQSYQTSFKETKFDKAKGPATFHGGVDVDAASGAVNIKIPLGPGIGARGLKYVPTVVGHWAPRELTKSWYVSGPDVNYSDPNSISEAVESQYSGGFFLDPGYLKLVLEDFEVDYLGNSPGGSTACSAKDEYSAELSNFQLPDGASSSFRMPDRSSQPIPSSLKLKQIISAFGFGAEWSIAKEKFNTSSLPADSSDDFVRIGLGGELIIGLYNENLANYQICIPWKGDPIYSPGETSDGSCPRIPSKILIIRGDQATEFDFIETKYSGYVNITSVPPYEKRYPLRIKYALFCGFKPVSIRNRQGDKITFNGGNAHWYHGNYDTDTGSEIQISNNIVSYIGDGPRPTYQVAFSAVAPVRGGMLDPAGWGRSKTKVDSITCTSTGETIRFNYSSQYPGNLQRELNYLNSIEFPGRRIDLKWEKYEYMNNANTPAAGYSGHYFAGPSKISLGWKYLPAYVYGVKSITETDLQTAPIGGVDIQDGAVRKTTHLRKIPKPDYTLAQRWSSWDFWDVTTHPDGTATLLKYAEPKQYWPSSSLPTYKADCLQELASLKHILVESRQFEKASDAIAEGQNHTPSSASVAYRIERHDRLDLRDFKNPDALITFRVVPYATRHQTWIPDGKILHETQMDGWDASPQVLAWTKTRILKHQADVLGEPETDCQSLVLRAQSLADVTPTLGVLRRETKTYSNNPDFWMWNKVESTRVTTEKDTTGFGTIGASTPPLKHTFDSDGALFTLNRTIDTTVGDGAIAIDGSNDGAFKLTYSYGTGTPESKTQPSRVRLFGFDATQAKAMGADYAYEDAFGFLTGITPLGGFSVSQSNNHFGLPKSQTDANGLTTTFTWDDLGRLTGINPPGSEIPTTIEYPDSRTARVVRGAQKQEFHYNGFGELIREVRWAGTAASNRKTGMDPMGRKVWQTVWVETEGSDTGWNNPLAAGDTCVYPAQWDETTTNCLSWEFIGKRKVCMEYEIIHHMGAPSISPVKGTHHWLYDSQGRIKRETDANGIITDTTYSGLSRTVAFGAFVTQFMSDRAGRLVQVKDAKAQVTTYSYDGSDRIASVVQPGEQGSQVRSWAYNSQGWLLTLTQPENGTTSYGAFTVQGKPRTTNYNGRGLASDFDALGRVKWVKSTSAGDISVNQSFFYDQQEPGHGMSNGKLIKAIDNNGERSLFYLGLNGRLSSLTRTLDGLPPFNQGLAYDNYGQLTSRTYPDGKVQVIHFDNARSMPDSTNFSDALLANFDNNNSAWVLKKLAYANGAFSDFDYDPDQVRLKMMKHTVPVVQIPAWNYSYNDPRGLLTSDQEDTYEYDELGRLKFAYVRDPFDQFAGKGSLGLMQHFEYDTFGNRTLGTTQTLKSWATGAAPAGTQNPDWTLRVGLDKVIANAMFNSADAALLKNQMPSSMSNGGTTGAHYDNQGNMDRIYTSISDPSTQVSLTYDALARVTTLTSRVGTEDYLHDDEGLRLRVYERATGKVRYNIYNEARQLIAQYEKVGTGPLTWKKDIVYVGTKEIAEVSSDGKTTVTMCDHLGSPRFTWNGTTLGKQKYLPFGEQLGSAGTAKGFTNHEQTDPSGMIYMQARFYLPMWGRFASPDPARDQHFEQTQSWNIYSYVQNSPVMHFDPDGCKIELSGNDNNRKEELKRITGTMSVNERKAFNYNQKGVLTVDPKVKGTSTAFKDLKKLADPKTATVVISMGTTAEYKKAATPGPSATTSIDLSTAGGGVAIPAPISLSGNTEVVLDPRGNQNGASNEMVAAHELFGHALDLVTTGKTSETTAVTKENKIGSEQTPPVPPRPVPPEKPNPETEKKK